MIGLCPSAYFEGFWHVRASLAVSVSAARQRRCALAPYRPRVVVRRTAPRPTSTTHESLTVLCGCRLLLVAEGRVGALKECQNQEWPSDTFSEMPLPLVPSAHRSNHYDIDTGCCGRVVAREGTQRSRIRRRRSSPLYRGYARLCRTSPAEGRL